MAVLSHKPEIPTPRRNSVSLGPPHDILIGVRRCGAFRRPSFRSLSILVGVCVIYFLAASSLARAQSKADEYRIKAAFLFHFAQLVDWPQAALGDEKNPLTLCTFGDDPFHGDLETTVQGKSIGTHPLQVRHAKQVEQIAGCHVLFIGSAERARASQLITVLNNDAVLTVGETDDFIKQGGIIGFRVEKDKVRFEINVEAADRAKLKISSRLLLLALNSPGNQG